MHIYIDTVRHGAQRYETCGDWVFIPEVQAGEGIRLEIKVSRMENEDYEFLVGVHELVEAYLCHKRGISEDVVTKFDIAFEASREYGDESEAGDNAAAPYHKEHVLASFVEKLLAIELGVNWKEYDKTVMNL